MKCKVPVAEASNDEGVLSERVEEALGHLVGAAREGLLALSVEVGLGVLSEWFTGKLLSRTRAGFEAMNAALKQRSEASA